MISARTVAVDMPGGPATATSPRAVSAGAADTAAGWQIRPSRRRVIAAVARRLVPYLVEATIIPTTIFYALLVVGGMRWALAGALAWSYGAIVRRALGGRPVPGLLILATIGISLYVLFFWIGKKWASWET